MRILLLLLLALASTQALAASFPCAKAKSKVEHLVCADPGLSRLDEQLAAAYKHATSDDWGLIANDQREWLRTVRDRCGQATCLDKAYRARIDVLVHWHDPAPWSDAMRGAYLEHTRVLVRGKTDWEPQESSDCLSISKSADGVVQLHIDSTQIDGFSCEVDMQARRYAQGYQTIPTPDDACVLVVRAENGALVVEESQNSCHAHCGARASLDGLSFRRDRRKPGRCALSGQ
jgi:uncharacterized protein